MYIALKSFSGKISASKGAKLEINDKYIAKDLLNAGYIEEINETKKDITDKKAKEKSKK